LCLEACPTGAIVEPYVLDATRCVSYLTIEVRGAIPPERHRDVGAHVFGCDICQEVCPYNAAVPVSARPEWQPRPALDGVGLEDLAALDDAQLGEVIAGTALRRAGVAGLRRNLDIARRNAARGAK
jgi:epoxyqueuosine reductase